MDFVGKNKERSFWFMSLVIKLDGLSKEEYYDVALERETKP